MRPVQLKRLRRQDVEIKDDENGTVWVPVGKSGRAEKITLPKTGVAAFKDLIRFSAIN